MPKSNGLKGPTNAHRNAMNEIRAGYQSDVASPRTKNPNVVVRGNGEAPRSTPVVREELMRELNSKK